MSRIVSILLLAAYHLGLIAPIIYALHYAHLIHYSNLLLVELLIAWLLYAGLGCAIDGRFNTWRMPVRQLMKKEEAVLLPLFHEVCEKAGVKRKYHLLLDASPSPGAFAVMPGWVVISEGMLRLLDKEEVKGVFAHEIAHLKSGDCIVIACLNITEFVINFIYPKIRFSFRVIRTFPILLAILAVLLFWFKLLFPASCLIAFIYLLPAYRRAFLFCFFCAMRKREYAADRFAQSLGYGEPMLRVLTKLKNAAPSSLSMYDITKMMHPIIHHRIISIERNVSGKKSG